MDSAAPAIQKYHIFPPPLNRKQKMNLNFPSRFIRRLCLSLLLLSGAARAQDPAALTARPGGDGGLVVILEPADPGLAIALAGSGRHLIAALSADAGRVSALDSAFMAADVHPVADALHWRTAAALPFPTHSVNILLLDAQTAQRLGREEISRVLVPGHGFALAGGQELRVPRPEGMDTWTGWNARASGNRMSRDTVLAPPNSIRWLTGPRHGGNHIVTDRVHYLEAAFATNHYLYDHIFGRPPYLGHARDAFSGVNLWKMRYQGDPTLLPWDNLIFSDGPRLFLPANNAGRGARNQPPGHLNLQMRDMLTGKVLAEALPNLTWGERVRAGQITAGDWGMAFSWAHRLIHDGTRMYQADGGHVVRALTPDGSRILWERSFEQEGFADMIATDGNTLALVISSTDNFPAPSFRNFNRNANVARRIIGLDPATGQERWRYEGVEGAPLAFLIVEHGVVAAATHLIGAKEARASASSMRSTQQVAEASLLVSLDAATGRENFRRRGAADFAMLENRGDRAGLNVRLNRIIYNESMFAYSFDIRSGELIDTVNWGGRFTGWSGSTQNYLLNGTRFRSHDGQVDVESGISHSDYSSFNRPANGSLYIAGGFRTTSTRHSVGETMALFHESTFPAAWPTERRLLLQGRAEGLREPQAADWPTFRGDSARRGWRPADGPAALAPAWQVQVAEPLSTGDGGIRYDWEQNSQTPGRITQSVADATRVLVSIPDRHELVCLNLANGQERWRTRLGARSAAPPTLAGDVAFVGLNDGTVTAINLNTGAPVWSFLAAPYERYHNAHQQLESTHPVRSSPILHNGLLYVAAGRHGRSDTGIHVWALDPATGTPRNHRVITARHVNDVMQLVGGNLVLAYSVLDPATLENAGPRSGPFLMPDEEGHDGGMGWTGPYLLWRGYRVHNGDNRNRAGAAIQTDQAFWRFIAGAFAEMPFDDLRNHRTVIRTGDERFSDRANSTRNMLVFLAGAGRHQYAVTRNSGKLRIALADTAAQTQQTYNFDLLQPRELPLPDGIALAQGHLIVTTTHGRVLAFRQP